jgi:hypothetical protein
VVGALAGWKLSIPVENPDGNATTVDPAEVSPPWLTVDDRGALVFWAPAEGATTKNSTHPRTELSSVDTFRSGRDRRTLRASIEVRQEPADGEGVIVAQIHGAKDIVSVPYVMVQLRRGALEVVVKRERTGNDAVTHQLLDAVLLGDRIEMEIADTGDGSMRFAAAVGRRSLTRTAPVPPAFEGAPVRFQAGAYLRVKYPAGPQDGGCVVFHQLERTAG